MKNHALKLKRAELNVSQDDVAQILGICRACYCRKENGHIKFSDADLLKLKKFLKLTDNEFINIFFEDSEPIIQNQDAYFF